MPAQAKVKSVDALDTFRAVLLNYVAKARPTLEEVTGDVTRLRIWLESTQRTFWENEAKKRRRAWEEAQQALFSAKLSNLRRESAAEVAAVHRARRAMEEADEKLRRVKRWAREYDSRVQPLVKQMEKLHTLLANDLIQAAAYLAESAQTLSDYADRRPIGAPAQSAPPTENAGSAATGDLTPAKNPA
jgi:hypothetical protein